MQLKVSQVTWRRPFLFILHHESGNYFHCNQGRP